MSEHCQTVHGSHPVSIDWDLEVLDNEKSSQYRKCLEAKYIHDLKPALNKGVGVHIMLKDLKL